MYLLYTRCYQIPIFKFCAVSDEELYNILVYSGEEMVLIVLVLLSDTNVLILCC
jgi:hypothetical protein